MTHKNGVTFHALTPLILKGSKVTTCTCTVRDILLTNTYHVSVEHHTLAMAIEGSHWCMNNHVHRALEGKKEVVKKQNTERNSTYMQCMYTQIQTQTHSYTHTHMYMYIHVYLYVYSTRWGREGGTCTCRKKGLSYFVHSDLAVMGGQ